jgi:hypothetical protein
MKRPHRKSRPDRLLDGFGDSLGELTSGKRSSLVKAGMVAGGAVVLTAGSAAISSLRRRLGESGS